MGLILVTGATGQIGSKIAEFIAAKELPLRLIGRSPEKLARFAKAEKMQADYADIASLDRAFAGVEKAFIVSGSAEPHKRALLHKNAFEAAARAGVSYIVYLSFLGAAADSYFPMSRDHYESQQYLANTGVAYTALQDSFYAELAVELFDKDGVMQGPAGEGSVSWVGRIEVAEAVAGLLAAEKPRPGIYPMTGTKAYTMRETATLVSQLTGRSLRYVDESVETAREWRAKIAPEPWEVDVWVGSYLAIAHGEVAAVTDDLGGLLGRPASDLESYLRKYPEFLA